MQVIARLGSLVTVNATPVTAHERKDSELQYMRSVLGGYCSLHEETFAQGPSRHQIIYSPRLHGCCVRIAR